MKPFFVYMLRCSDGSYYVGHTDELERRIPQHQAGEVEGYTHERRPVDLVWSQETASREEALAAERRIKGWSRAKKEALIEGDWDRVKQLAKSRGPGTSTGSVRTGVPIRAESGELPGHTEPTETSVRSEPREKPVRTEPVEVPEPRQPVLRQAQDERGGDTALLTAILARDRRAIAKAITLIESTRPDHRSRADELLNALLPHTGHAIRLGISGVPGVGKSTFIEALGLALIDKGHKVAVLTVDPSSSVSGGSILGDKTRMEKLSVDANAYIRPSPASGTLGGVAEKTREAMLVCEAAGHDVVIVETVGVGQSETAVAHMTDMFALLQLPNAGDDLQAIKKGVMELADLVVVNKADIDPDAATRAEATITSALRVFSFHGKPGHWAPKVMRASALKRQGIAEFWSLVEQFRSAREASGEFAARRKSQALAWTWDLIHARLQTDFRHHPAVRAALHDALHGVAEARIAPSVAARTLLDLFERD